MIQEQDGGQARVMPISKQGSALSKQDLDRESLDHPVFVQATVIPKLLLQLLSGGKQDGLYTCAECTFMMNVATLLFAPMPVRH